MKQSNSKKPTQPPPKKRKCCQTATGKDVPHLPHCPQLVGRKPVYPVGSIFTLTKTQDGWDCVLVSEGFTAGGKAPGRRRAMNTVDRQWRGPRRPPKESEKGL